MDSNQGQQHQLNVNDVSALSMVIHFLCSLQVVVLS